MALSKNLTISQIAEKAHVSIATASRVINQPGAVKPATREKVLQAMKDLNYQYKGNRNDSKFILTSFPDFDNPFNAEIISGIQAAAKRRGYRPFLQQMEDFRSPDSYKFLLNQQVFGGIIFAHLVPDKSLLDSLCLQHPVVMCSEHSDTDAVPFVAINDYSAAHDAMDYLISIGKKRIALLNSSLDYNYAVHRERGYRAALTHAGLPVQEEWIVHLPGIDAEFAYSTAVSILSAPERPDAFFCVSDMFASAVIKAARSLNLSIPQDVAILGFDNIYLTTMTVPSITTVSQPTYQIGHQSCNLLIDLMEGKTVLNKRVILDTELIVRGST